MNSIENLYMNINDNTSKIILNKEGKNKYAFLRFYTTIYKKEVFSAGKVLKIGTTHFSDPLASGKVYTHVAINYSLDDKFVGLNLDPKDPNDVKVEAISDPNYDRLNAKSRDKRASQFVVYALPITGKEHLRLKYILDRVSKENNLTYDIRSLVYTGMLLMKNRFKNFMGFEDYDQSLEKIAGVGDDEYLTKLEMDEAERIAMKKNGFICSTFVMYVLKNCSDDILRWMDREKKDVYEFSPNTVAKIPYIFPLFGGSWVNYKRILNQFIQKNIEFKEYIKQ